MLDARDAMLAADRMRFGGRDLKVMWDAFAARGMGKGASTPNADSGDPAELRLAAGEQRHGTFRTPGAGKIFVGRYEARVTPVADTSGGRSSHRGEAGARRYQMLFVSSGARLQAVHPRSPRPAPDRAASRPPTTWPPPARRKVIASSSGSLNPKSLIDGTEATNWGGVERRQRRRDPPVRRRRPGRAACTRPPGPGQRDAQPGAGEPDRRAAGRRPRLGVALHGPAPVRARGAASGTARRRATWKRFYTSSADAFPAMRPRPVAPNLILRSFRVPTTRAAAIRFVALENQCTGFAGYAGEQDNDPTNNTDCKTGSDRGTIVHAAELQVY